MGVTKRWIYIFLLFGTNDSGLLCVEKEEDGVELERLLMEMKAQSIRGTFTFRDFLDDHQVAQGI